MTDLKKWIAEQREVMGQATARPWDFDSCGDVWSTAEKTSTSDMAHFMCCCEVQASIGTTRTGPDNPNAAAIVAAVNNYERVLKALEIAVEALEGLLVNVATDWYVEHFSKDETPKGANTGIAAHIHNRELRERINAAFHNARTARVKVREALE